jgi:hypothetical protein
MKNFLIAVSLMLIANFTNAKQIALNGNYTTTGYTGSDTFYTAQSNYQYMYFGQCNGLDSQHRMVIHIVGNVYFTGGGIKFENSKYIKVYSDIPYGLNISNAGTAFTITGKSKCIDLSGFYGHNLTGGGIFVKTDVSDVQTTYNCDSSFLNWTFDSIVIHDFKMVNITGDCIYEGETDPYGVSRSFYCWGAWRYHKPAGLAHCSVYNGYIDSVTRQGIQINACHVASIYNCTIKHCGLGMEEQQGSDVWIGGGTDSFFVYNLVLGESWQHAFQSNGFGYGEVHDIYTDSTGIVYGTRKGHGLTYTGWNKIGQFSWDAVAKNDTYNGDGSVWDMSPLWFTLYSNPVGYTCTLKIWNITSGWSTDKNGYSVAIDQNSNWKSICIIDAGKVYSPNKIFTTDCPVDTIAKPVIDSTIAGVDVIFHFKNAADFRPVNWKNININYKGNYVIKYADSTRQILKAKP